MSAKYTDRETREKSAAISDRAEQLDVEYADLLEAAKRKSGRIVGARAILRVLTEIPAHHDMEEYMIVLAAELIEERDDLTEAARETYEQLEAHIAESEAWRKENGVCLICRIRCNMRDHDDIDD